MWVSLLDPLAIMSYIVGRAFMDIGASIASPVIAASMSDKPLEAPEDTKAAMVKLLLTDVSVRFLRKYKKEVALKLIKNSTNYTIQWDRTPIFTGSVSECEKQVLGMSWILFYLEGY